MDISMEPIPRQYGGLRNNSQTCSLGPASEANYLSRVKLRSPRNVCVHVRTWYAYVLASMCEYVCVIS